MKPAHTGASAQGRLHRDTAVTVRTEKPTLFPSSQLPNAFTDLLHPTVLT